MTVEQIEEIKLRHLALQAEIEPGMLSPLQSVAFWKRLHQDVADLAQAVAELMRRTS